MSGRAPIVVDCEGAGCPPCAVSGTLGLCAMCGRLVQLDDDDRVREHERDDVLAMLERGDYG